MTRLRQHLRCSAVIGAIVTLLSCLANPCRGNDDAQLIRQILDAWRERQERFRTVHIEWNVEEKVKAQRYPDKLAKTNERGRVVYAQPFIALKLQEAILLDGPKLSLSLKMSRDQAERHSMHITRQLVSDGKFTAEYSTVPNRPLGQGDIKNEPYTWYFTRTIHCEPCYEFFRPCIAELTDFSGRAEDFTIVDRETPVGGHPCIVLDEQSATMKAKFPEGYRRRFYLDAAEKYIPRRSENFRGDFRMHVLDFRYARDPLWGLLPSSWICTMYTPAAKGVATSASPAVVDAASEIVVTNCLVNIPIKPDEFQLRFPSGAVVTDNRSGEPSVFISKGALAGEEPPAPPRHSIPSVAVPASGHGWLFRIFAALGGAILLLVAYRRFHRA